MDEREVNIWKKTIAVNNKSIDAYYKLGKYYLSKNELAPAKECFDSCLRILPELSSGWVKSRHEDTFLCLATIAQKKNDVNESLKNLKKLLSLAPEKGEYMITTAELLMKMRQYEFAKELLNKSIETKIESDKKTHAKKLIVKIMTLQGDI